jgi:uncharacterized protein (DUF1330 family)
MMPAYLVANVTWNDTEAARRYFDLILESFKPFGGRYLARGPIESVIEGSGAPQRLAIVEFPSADAARRWHDSEVYRPARDVRHGAASTHWLVVIDGVPG